MLYSRLGRSGIDVSRGCLGSITWGMQNNKADADEQIPYALDKGVNFIQTAQMYAVPPSPDTYGKPEEINGNWLARKKANRAHL
ncbi:aldo/keto reductase, partial [Pseudoalteromonas sp. S2721]|uniref:aldo/keto reductase n=1 Tax=Pseudoalteromonas sp. S2721 TaxID=579526 RepID=UPI00126F82B4